MFDEFEVICPKCNAILRVNNFDVEEIEPRKTYRFRCVDCNKELELNILVKEV